MTHELPRALLRPHGGPPAVALALLLSIITWPAAVMAEAASDLVSELADAEGRERLPLLIDLVVLARDESVPDVAKYGAEALERLEAEPDTRSEVRVRLALAWALAQGGDSMTALGHANQALEIVPSLDDPELLADAQYCLAVAHYYGSQPIPAIEAAQAALALQKERGLRRAAARSATLVGVLERSRGNYVTALDHHLEALGLSEQGNDDHGVARSRNNIALLYRELDHPEEALEYFQQASTYYREQGATEQLVTTLNNIGFTLVEMHRSREALPVLEEGLRLGRELDRPFTEARLLSNVAFAQEKLDNIDSALEYQKRTLELRTRLGDARGLARTLGSLGKLGILEERWDEAEDYLVRGLAQAESVGARTEESQILDLLGRVYEQQGRPAEALAAIRKHLEIQDDLDRDGAAQRLAQVEFDRQRAMQDLRLSLEETRSRVLQLATALLVLLAAGLVLYARTRNRSLTQLRVSHSKLEQANALIEESEQRYRSLFFDEVVAKLLVDRESGTLVDANAPAAALSGLSAEELRGRSVDDIRLGWLRDAARRWREVEAQELSISHRYVEQGGEHLAQIHLAPVAVSGRPSVLLTVHDLTEKMRAEDDRIRIDKLESLGQLAGGIAHNFNNALAAVLGYVGVARSEAKEDSEIGELLALAEDSVADSAALTSQLLSFSQGGAPQRQLLDLGEQIRSAVRFVAANDPRVEVEIQEQLWPARVDPAQFQQMIGNLVTNALEAADTRVRVVVESEKESENAEGFMRIEVTDDGEGVAPEIQAKIMDPYFTTKTGRTGLGLATAFAIAQRHQGHLDFSSVPGQGSTFRVLVPACPEERRPESVVTTEPVRGGHERILVMDDDPAIRAVYQGLLERNGYEVVSAAEGRAAYELYRQARAKQCGFDLVILDLTVPAGLGGKATMELLLEEDPETLAIVISGYSDDPVMADFESHGFAASMPKPFRYDDLARLVRAVLDQRESASELQGGARRSGDAEANSG